MATYAEATDVAARWGKDPETFEPETTALIEVRLGDVERMIARRFKALSLPTLAEQVAAQTLDPADVKQVESEAVLRLVRNPDGYMSETDGNYTYMVQNDLATGKLEILAEEWATLGVSAGGMFVIAPNAVLAS